MDVEFIGMIATREYSEIHPPQGPAIDLDYVRRFAQAHECSGFDRILIGYFSNGPDGFIVASYAAAATGRLGLMLAHRPGFVAPTLAARKLATLDQFTGGRLAVHIISGGDDGEQQRDGDYSSHRARYVRTDEYVGILKRIWASAAPIDHDGPFYRFRSAYSEVKPLKGHLPIYFGGSSQEAIDVAGRHADIYALWGEPLEQVAETIAKVRASAARYQRRPRFSLSLRPILASTEAEAWKRAEHILETFERVAARGCWVRRTVRRKMSARSGCWRRRRAARCWTNGCGRPWRPLPARAATPPRWSARRSRSPNRCSPTTTWV